MIHPFDPQTGRYRRLARLVVATYFALFATIISPVRAPLRPNRIRPFEERLETRIGHFDSAGRPLLDGVIELAYEHHLPLGLEYLDEGAVRKPLRIKLTNKTIREILTALAKATPGYEVSFSSGVVEIYSPRARQDPSNLLNTVISDFGVKDEDPQVASYDLAGALIRKFMPDVAIVRSIPVGSLGPSKVTLRLHDSKVYEILDALISANGETIWVVRVPSGGLSTLERTRWYVYGLDSAFKDVVLQDARNLFPNKR